MCAEGKWGLYGVKGKAMHAVYFKIFPCDDPTRGHRILVKMNKFPSKLTLFRLFLGRCVVRVVAVLGFGLCIGASSLYVSSCTSAYVYPFHLLLFLTVACLRVCPVIQSLLVRVYYISTTHAAHHMHQTREFPLTHASTCTLTCTHTHVPPSPFDSREDSLLQRALNPISPLRTLPPTDGPPRADAGILQLARGGPSSRLVPARGAQARKSYLEAASILTVQLLHMVRVCVCVCVL